jgi:hypothetical protein
VTLHWTDLIFTLAIVAVGCAIGYMLSLRRLKQIVMERQFAMADQLGRLDEAIRALETRLTEHHALSGANESKPLGVATNEQQEALDGTEAGDIPPEIQVVIAAAAVGALGENARVRSVKPAASPWSQQGRVLVQGSHNLRVRG